MKPPQMIPHTWYHLSHARVLKLENQRAYIHIHVLHVSFAELVDESEDCSISCAAIG